MKAILYLAAVAVLFLVPSPCFALWEIAAVTKERATELGMEIRAKAAGPNAVRVELEFKLAGELKNFHRVDLRFGDGGQSVLTAPLREDRSRPDRVVVSFNADRTRLDEVNLWVMVPAPLGGTAYEVNVKDFVEAAGGAANLSAQNPTETELLTRLPAREREFEEAAQSLSAMVYGPKREDGSREATLRKDAVGKRVVVEGIAWGQPFGRKGQEGTISPWAGPQVIHQGGSVFVKGIDFTETKALGKPVRVSGILKVDPGTHTRFGDLKPYYFIEATSLDVLDAVTDPFIVLAKE